MAKTLDKFQFPQVTAAEFQPLEDLLGKGFKDATYDIARCLFATLLKSEVISKNLTPDEISQISLTQVATFLEVFGGQNIYISVDLISEQEVRNAAIRRYEISEQSHQVHIYKTLDALPLMKVSADKLRPLDDLLGTGATTYTHLIARCLFILLLKDPVVSINLKPKEIAEVAILQTRNICSMFGGGNLYVPKEMAVKNSVRNEVIKREFNGKNMPYLAMKNGISYMQIRNILGFSKPKSRALKQSLDASRLIKKLS